MQLFCGFGVGVLVYVETGGDVDRCTERQTSRHKSASDAKSGRFMRHGEAEPAFAFKFTTRIQTIACGY